MFNDAIRIFLDLQQPFMSPRYPGGPGPRGPGPGVRMPPQQVDFNSPGGPGPMMPGSMDPSRQGQYCLFSCPLLPELTNSECI